MDAVELRPGLWRWASRHPDWEPEPDEGLPLEVGSVYFEAPGAVVLVDPLVPAGDEEDRFWLALDRDVGRLGLPVVVLLTVPWHERSASRVTERYGATVSPDPPAGVEAIRIAGVGGEPEAIFWLPGPAALIFGDILVGTPARVADEWLTEEQRGQPIRAALRPLLELPFDLLLLAHGEAVTEGARGALESALS